MSGSWSPPDATICPEVPTTTREFPQFLAHETEDHLRFLWMLDEFENPEARAPDRLFSARSQGPVMKGCFACHGLPGDAAFNSYFDYRDHAQAGDAVVRPFSLSEMPVSEVAGAAVEWKEGRTNWAALRKLWEE